MKGKIIRSTGSWYSILDEARNRYDARLRGKFKNEGLKVTNPIAVGDNVVFNLDEDGIALITKIEARENYIIRKSTHKTGHGHLIASNIDQAIIIATIANPRTSLGFIDRFLVSSEAFRIPAILVFNKEDLLSEEDKEFREAIFDLYTSIGYTCMATSAQTEKGIAELKATLEGKITLLSGHSGVGKSSLVNKIDPRLDLKTTAVSGFSKKGVHTTTFAEMFQIADKSFIIDTPGIKELGMIDMEQGEIGHYFPEMRALVGACKFHNCLHVNEPGCVIKEKVQSEEISESRYYSYLGMLEEKDSHR